MGSAIVQVFALPFFLSIAIALPSLSGQLRGGVDRVAPGISLTTPNPFPEYPVSCLHTVHNPTLVSSDCTYLLNQMLLQEPNIFPERAFRYDTFRTDAGRYAPSRWQYGHYKLSVRSHRRDAKQQLTLLNVALTANKVFHKCVSEVSYPIEGISLIGSINQGFHVLLTGYGEPESNSAKNSSASDQSAVSVSRRAMQAQHESGNPTGSQRMEIKDPLMSVHRVSNHPGATVDLTYSAAVSPTYPVHCFNPYIIHLQPAEVTHCSYIINHIILRLFDPMRQLTFGFTDAADINLSKPEYQQWQYGHCKISVMDTPADQIDSFRLLDVATTARRIVTQCVANTQDKIGGVAGIGTDAKGFYIYVGGLWPHLPRSVAR